MMHLRCGGNCKNGSIANYPHSVPVKGSLKWSIFGEDMDKSLLARFQGPLSMYGLSVTDLLFFLFFFWRAEGEVLSSARWTMSTRPFSVYSVILSSHCFLWPPCLLMRRYGHIVVVPSMISFSRLLCLVTRPKYFSFRHFTWPSKALVFSDPSQNLVIRHVFCVQRAIGTVNIVQPVLCCIGSAGGVLLPVEEDAGSDNYKTAATTSSTTDETTGGDT